VSVAQDTARPVSGARSLAAPNGAAGEGLALVLEQVAEFGGVERIAETLMTVYPRASVTSVRFDPRDGMREGDFEARLRERNGGAEAHPVRLVGPGGHRKHYLLPLYARYIGSAPLDGASVVLSLGGVGWSLAAAVPQGARHVAYIGGAPRPLYGWQRDYIAEYRRALRPLLRAAIPALRAQHRRLVQRPERVATNSHASARGLESIVGRPVEVIHPPVRSDFFTPADRERRHFLAVARTFGHKRLDVVVEAFRELGEPLVVAGGGSGLARMRREAPANVTFVGHVGNQRLRELYRASRALVSASVEEFGICLAEAQSAGVPVIAPRAGGSAEIVRHGESGILLDEITPAALAGAVRRVERMELDPDTCRAVGESFSEARFVSRLEALLA
jgi:glycosyltransferase involved in cell wall biosynthesis